MLNDLPIFLRGYDKSLNVPGYEAALIIVLDNDRNNPAEFQKKLEELAKSQMISIDHVFCIAVEEMEAWLLGDRNAVLKAYPSAKTSLLNDYEQDSICGCLLYTSQLESTPEGFRPITGEAGRKEKKRDPLTIIIDKINEKYGTN